MSTFLALTFSPALANTAMAAELLERGSRFSALLHDGREPQLISPPRDAGQLQLLLGDAQKALHYSSETDALGLILGCEAYDLESGRLVAPSQLANLAPPQAPAFLRRLAPPFGGLLRSGADQPLVAATDSSGLYHIYSFEAQGWSAVCSSAILLAAVTQAQLDPRSIGLYALIGNFTGDDSPFQGIRKLGAGSTIALDGGRLDYNRYDEPAKVGDRFETMASATDAGAQVIGGCLETCLMEHPDAVLELSGGLDSRLVLAALPKALRQGRHAVTLGSEGDGDLVVARKLAKEFGLEHRWIDFAGLGALDVEQAVTLVKRAARLRDHSANPLAVGVLEWVQGQLDDRPRLTGQNGEFARGFFYPGQPSAPATTPALAEALAKWRIMVNDAVDGELFAAGDAKEFRGQAVEATCDFFAQRTEAWLDATDEYYLDQRMQHWVGLGYSSVSQRRPVLSPFFHPSFLEWSRRVRPEHKHGSGVFCELISHFDPSLGRLPLDTGLSPFDLRQTTALSQFKVKADFLRRASRKLRQRLFGLGKAAAGAEIVAERVRAGVVGGEISLERVRGLPFIAERYVDAVAAGSQKASSSSLGLLLNLEWILEFTEG